MTTFIDMGNNLYINLDHIVAVQFYKTREDILAVTVEVDIEDPSTRDCVYTFYGADAALVCKNLGLPNPRFLTQKGEYQGGLNASSS